MTVIDPPIPLAPPAQSRVTPLVDVAAGAAPRRRVPRGARRLVGPIALVAVWQVLSTTGVLDRTTLAAPSDAWSAGVDLVARGELQNHLWTSLQRVLWGLALGVSAGTGLAVAAGTSRFGDDILDSTMQVLRAIPVLALTPLLILWLGIQEEPKIAMVAIAVTFPVYLNTHGAIRGVDGKLVEAARTFGVRRWELIKDVILPGALPGFLVGLRYAFSISWLVLVISEQINATSGIGYLMNEARGAFRTDVIVVGLVIYGVLGLVSDGIVRFLEGSLLSWRRGLTT